MLRIISIPLPEGVIIESIILKIEILRPEIILLGV
jgi:hypothetical protein